jgi:hypothetical protein
VPVIHGLSAEDAVNALGSAWTVAGLYADVAHREPFAAAVERLARWNGPVLGVRSSGFVLSGEPLPGPDAATRFASALFVHGVEALGFDEALTPDSLAAFFRIVALAPDVVDDRGGLVAMVAAASLSGIDLRVRAMLGATGLEVVDHEGDLAVVLAEDDPGMGSTFLDRLETVVSQADVDERTNLMLDLVDQFARFDASRRAELVDRLLGSARTDIRDLFLDQLAPNDLAELVEHLDPGAFQLLGEYAARVDGARRSELAEAIGDPGSTLEFRSRVAESVRERMEGIRIASLQGPMADLGVDREAWFRSAVDVMGGLVMVEDRPDRVVNLAKAWRTVVSDSLAGGEDERALAWYRSVADLEELPIAMAEVLDEVPGRAEVTALVERRNARRPGAVAFVDHLLAIDPVRVLGPLAAAGADAEHLARFAASDPEALIAALDGTDDPVPIVLALKTSGYRGAAPGLVELLDDPRARGRSEVLVLVGPSLGVERLGRLLNDTDASVRRLAAELLRRGRTLAGAKLLFDRFMSVDVDDDERQMIAHLLAATSDGSSMLEEVKGRGGLRLSATGRRLRAAAKTALASKGGRQ